MPGMPVQEAVRAAAGELAAAGVPSPQFDAEELAAHSLGVRAQGPLARVRRADRTFAAYVRRRAAREPLQHITGRAHFRHLDLAVGPGVFVPRPETEVVVDAVLAASRGADTPTGRSSSTWAPGRAPSRSRSPTRCPVPGCTPSRPTRAPTPGRPATPPAPPSTCATATWPTRSRTWTARSTSWSATRPTSRSGPWCATRRWPRTTRPWRCGPGRTGSTRCGSSSGSPRACCGPGGTVVAEHADLQGAVGAGGVRRHRPVDRRRRPPGPGRPGPLPHREEGSRLMAWIRRYDMSLPGERPVGIEQATDAVRRGELVVLPTDTVYGLGTDAFSPEAVGDLLAAKGRGRDMPVPVLVGSPRTLDGIATRLGTAARALVEAFWPGGLTLVAHAQPSLQWDLGDTGGTVAVRMPLHPVAIELLQATGPMAVSSANTHRPPAGHDRRRGGRAAGRRRVGLPRRRALGRAGAVDDRRRDRGRAPGPAGRCPGRRAAPRGRRRPRGTVVQ